MTPNALNYHHLLYCWAVAKEGSLRRASEVLHVSQPSISAQLKQLEESLGALAGHKLDVVLADEPSTSALRVRCQGEPLRKKSIYLRRRDSPRRRDPSPAWT